MMILMKINIYTLYITIGTDKEGKFIIHNNANLRFLYLNLQVMHTDRVEIVRSGVFFSNIKNLAKV